MDIEMDYVELPPRKSDQRFFVADISKAAKILDWTPTVERLDGIDKMLDWSFKSNACNTNTYL